MPCLRGTQQAGEPLLWTAARPTSPRDSVSQKGSTGGSLGRGSWRGAETEEEKLRTGRACFLTPLPTSQYKWM